MAASTHHGADVGSKAWGFVTVLFSFPYTFHKNKNKAQQPYLRVNPALLEKSVFFSFIF